MPGATRAHLDDERVRTFAARFTSGSAMDGDDLLEARRLLARPPDNPAGPRVPTVAGLLLLGTHPQQFLPHARVAVVRYAGPTMGERFLARELEGPIPAQLDAAAAWLATTMLHAVELKGFGRTDRDEYPIDSLREIVLNALVHRDYLATGDRVRIYLFSDRCEVVSPGKLSGPMRLEDNLLTERWSRNGALVQGLSAMGIMEELGFGLNRVTQQFADEGLPPPEFRQTEATFVVTLRGRGARMLEEAAPARETPAAGATRTTRAARQAWALDHLRTTGTLTARAFAAAQGVSEDTALRDLRDLVERRLVEARGATNNRHYVLRVDGDA